MTQQPRSITRTFYGLRSIASGELVNVHDGAEGPMLTMDEFDPVFEAVSEEALAMAMFEQETPSYFGTSSHPNWGRVEREDVVPVRVTTVETFEPVSLPRIWNLKTVQVRDIPYKVARKYAGHEFELLAGQKNAVFWLAVLPEGETVANAREALVGRAALSGDIYTKRHVYACVDVPEDYADMLKGKPGVLVVASSHV